MIQADTAASLIDQIEIPLFRLDWREVINLPLLINTGLRVLVVFALAWLAYHGLGLLLRRLERTIEEGDGGSALQEQRAKTLLGLVRSIGIAFIGLLILFMFLGAIGVQIAPLLAGAGVLGLAISFGSQSLVRDVISGLFILFEDQFRVGDVIRVGDTGGAVERMTLRIVILRDVHGVMHVIPNGEIKQVSNLTRSFSRAVFEVGVAYKENVDRVMEVMRDIGREMWEDEQWRPLLVEEIKVPGVESFGDSAINIRIMATTVPLKQWEVARELRRRIKNRFDAEGIEIPFPHQTLFWGEGQKPEPRETGNREPGTAARAAEGPHG